jgi:hypothetical protein
MPNVKKQIKLKIFITFIIFPFPPSAEVVICNKQTLKVPDLFGFWILDFGFWIGEKTLEP